MWTSPRLVRKAIWALVSLAIVISIPAYKLTASKPSFPEGRGFKEFRTGIPVAEYTWCDNQHVLAARGTVSGSVFRPAEGQYIYFDVANPKVVKVIDLSPYLPLYGEPQRFIRNSTQLPYCKGHELIFSRFQKDSIVETYLVNVLTMETRLLVSGRYTGSPLQMFFGGARYMLASKRPINDGGKKNDVPENNCSVEVLHPGYQIFCVERLEGGARPLPNVVLVINHNGMLLKDRKFNTISNLEEDRNFWIERHAGIAPDGRYVYSGCTEKGRRTESADLGICRYLLDGSSHAWEKVISFNASWHERTLFTRYLKANNVIVAGNGDIYFSISGDLYLGQVTFGYWKYAKSGEYTKICERCLITISPDGKKLVVQMERPVNPVDAHEFTYYEIQAAVLETSSPPS